MGSFVRMGLINADRNRLVANRTEPANHSVYVYGHSAHIHTQAVLDPREPRSELVSAATANM